MSQPFGQSTGDALRWLDQAEQHFHNASQLNDKALDTATQICAVAWTGNASARFLQCAHQLHDDTHPHIQKGLSQVDTHRNTLHAQANQDQEL
jgi:hypothetical protein